MANDPLPFITTDRGLGLLGRLVNRMLPAGVAADPEEARRGRLLVPVAFLLTLAAFYFCWEGWRTTYSLEGSSLILFVAGILSLFNVPIMWWLQSVRVAGVVTATELTVVVFLCGWVNQGVADASQRFMVVAPLVAAFIIGPRAGALFAAACAGLTLVLHHGTSFGHVFNPRQETDFFFHTTGGIFVMGILTLITYMYEEARRTNLELVQRVIRQLQDKNAEMAAVNNELATRRDDAVDDARRKDAFLERMQLFSSSQAKGLDRTRHATAQLSETIRTIARNAETLASTAAQSDQRLAGMAANAASVKNSVEELLHGVDETSAALTQLSTAANEVHSQLGALSRSATNTTSAMVAMEESASRVEQAASRTAALSGAVIEDAERGRDAMRRAQLGVDEIRAASNAVDAAIRALGARISAISGMNSVIGEVAVETNVLALNASIIAAQAGAHGAGFTVVADQIKALAARTAVSTREISAVIAAVAEERDAAVAAIERGERAVEAGVALSADAQAALEQIVASAHAATEQVQDIEVATVEQARRARTVAEAMEAVARQVSTAVAATSEQARARQQIESAMQRLRLLGPELESRSQAQVDAADAARQAMRRITERASELSDVQGAQARAADQTVRAIEEIHSAHQGQTQAVRGLDAGPV